MHAIDIGHGVSQRSECFPKLSTAMVKCGSFENET